MDIWNYDRYVAARRASGRDEASTFSPFDWLTINDREKQRQICTLEWEASERNDDTPESGQVAW